MILRKAVFSELPFIWEILQQAIEQRRLSGSDQWQDGYPNQQVVTDDITNGHAYAAIIFDTEPAYTDIKGNWLTNDDYVVVHRVATANAVKGKGVATHLFMLIENLCVQQKVYSIKVDTNFDNIPTMDTDTHFVQTTNM